MPIASGAHGWSEGYRKRPRKEYVKPVREDTPTRYSKYIAKKNRQRAKDDPPLPRQMSPYEVSPVLARKEQRKRDPDPLLEEPSLKESEPAKPESESSPTKLQNNAPTKETKMVPRKLKPQKPILVAEATQQELKSKPASVPDVQPESKPKDKSESKQDFQGKQHSRQKLKQPSAPKIESKIELNQESKHHKETKKPSQDTTDEKPLPIPLEKETEAENSSDEKPNPPQGHKDPKIVPVIIPRHPPKWFESYRTPSPSMSSDDDMLRETDLETSSEELDYPKLDTNAENKEQHGTLVSLPLKKEEIKVENRKNQENKEEPRKDAEKKNPKKNPDNYGKNKNKSAEVDGKEKETKNRQIKSVIVNSDKIENIKNEKMEEKIGASKKKDQTAESEYKRTEEMHRTNTEILKVKKLLWCHQ